MPLTHRESRAPRSFPRGRVAAADPPLDCKLNPRLGLHLKLTAERNTCRRGAGGGGGRGRVLLRGASSDERLYFATLLTYVKLVRGALFETRHTVSPASTKHREHPRRHFRFCYVRMQRARVQDVYTHTCTHTGADRTGASSSTLNHVRLSPTDARARTYSIRFFTRSDWPLLHGAVRQSDRVVDKLTRYMPTTLRPWYTPRFYCFPNSSSGIFKLVFPPPTSIPNKRNLKSNDPSLTSWLVFPPFSFGPEIDFIEINSREEIADFIRS